MNFLILKDGRHGDQALLRTSALSEILKSKSLIHKEIDVEIVENIKVVRDRIRSKPIHAVIFLTRTLAETAQKMAAEYPPTRFFIFTGRIPEGREIWIEREWVSPEFLRSIVSTIDEF